MVGKFKIRAWRHYVAGRVVRAAALCALLALAVPTVSAAVPALAPPALAPGNGLALTPPMGWNDWNAYGCNVNEQLMCLDAYNNQTTPGTKVEIWGCNGQSKQQWTLG